MNTQNTTVSPRSINAVRLKSSGTINMVANLHGLTTP